MMTWALHFLSSEYPEARKSAYSIQGMLGVLLKTVSTIIIGRPDSHPTDRWACCEMTLDGSLTRRKGTLGVALWYVIWVCVSWLTNFTPVGCNIFL